MSAVFTEQHKIETFKSMIEISRDAYKYLILLNGGAAAGMVTMLDKIVHIVDGCTIRYSMGAFIIGLVLAVLAVVFAWGVQNALHNENIANTPENTHIIWMWGAFFTVLFSLLAFLFGAWGAVSSIPN